MQQPTSQLVNPVFIIQNLWKNRFLIKELVKRELKQQYQGSFLGSLWTVLVPLVMLVIYTFVFSVILKARWATTDGPTPPGEFALILFAGLVPFTMFSVVVNRAPTMVLQFPNYVKKVVFPLEILPVVALGTALVNSLISLCLVLVGGVVLLRNISSTLYLLPLAYIPLIFLSLGLGWLLASLGVFVRDIGQVIGLVVQVLFFMTPIFYPASLVPAKLQIIFIFNPLVEVVENFRRVLLWSQPIEWGPWLIWTVITGSFLILSYVWFIKTKKGFADVI